MRRNNAAINQQKELHQLAVQRERLQIKALEEQMTKQAEANAAKLEREREVRGLNLDRPLSSILPNDNANSVYYSFTVTRAADSTRTGVAYAAYAERTRNTSNTTGGIQQNAFSCLSQCDRMSVTN